MPRSQDGDAPAQLNRSASSSSSSTLPPVRPITFPKNRSATSIYSLHGTSSAHSMQPPRRGMSFDVGSPPGDSDGQQSTVKAGLGPSGLHRIRSIPNRMPSLARTTSAVESHAAMSITIPEISPTDIRTNPGPMTAGVLNLSTSLNDDLRRFPSESLHSFSFSNTTDETLHARHSIIKRSVDFLREQPGWSAAQLGMAHAQARASGDLEVQSMMELLAKTDVGSKLDSLEQRGFTVGPLTGPAGIQGENVFEKEFMEQSDSPTSIDAPRLGKTDSKESSAFSQALEDVATPTQETFSLQTDSIAGAKENALKINTSFGNSPTITEDDEDSGPIMPKRSSLKRTYTDVGPLELQNRLVNALNQPYTTNNPSLLSPIGASPNMSSTSVFGSALPTNAPQPHGRTVPTTQAIFTTETSEPWTITASNDLACLVFGVTKAELRKIGILELVKEEYRKWLLDRLKIPGSSSKSTPRDSPTRASLVGKNGSLMGNGITAKLLSKPSSRETGQGRRSKAPQDGKSPSPARARGVLLCGDVLPILKRNGTVSSASFWVQEKRSALIWVMEEIIEDVAYLRVDEIGCVAKGYGALEGVWGMERVKPGVDVARLIPEIPRRKDTNTGALDVDQIAALRRFTARTANDISIPITVDLLPDEPVLRIQSFPNIAGMVVLSASTLKVTSSNTAVSEALFGRSPNGVPMTEIIPGFDKMLQLLVDSENVDLEEGLVIPEHSFRRARAMIALREGKGDAAAAFLRPSGLPAIHRDGAEIMVDVQMRIVKSEALNDRSPGANSPQSPGPPSSELVYALWVTYSRTLHAVNHGIGPVSPLVSRPGTPPIQPSPGPHVQSMSSDESDSDDLKQKLPPPVMEVPEGTTQTGTSAAALTSSDTDVEKPVKEGESHKKSISDFQILEEMGAGAYGQVKLVRNKLTGAKAVIKYVTKRRILVDTWTRDRRLGTVPLEIHVLDYLRRDGFKHPNIVEMSDFFEDDTNYYIEMVPHGLPGMDLFDCIELRVNMEEAECKRIFVQVASAIEFLHTKAKVVHRDIKDENVVLDGEGRVKLIDFGSASYIKNGPFDVFVGTIDYASPEVLAGRSYTGPEQDIWALGILLYTILYKENPFYSIDEIMDHDLRVPYLVSEESIELVRLMLERDVEKRIDIKQIMEHRWCQGVELPV